MRLRIGGKVLITMLGVFVPSLVAFSVLMLGATGGILRANAVRHGEELAARSAEGVNELVRGSEKAVLTIADGARVTALVQAMESGDPAAVRARVEALEQAFLSFQALETSIQAIRFVDRDGYVLAKVREGRIVPREGPVSPSSGLPAVGTKGERDFFRETMRLAPGQVYISNLERGWLGEDEAWCPSMVRFSTPVSPPGGAPAGMVVINVWGEAVGAILNRLIAPAEGSAFLLERNLEDPERNGIFLFHQDRSCEFGNQTGSWITVFDRYPAELSDAWMREEAGVSPHPDSDDLLAHRFYSPYGADERGWVVVVDIKRSFFMKPLGPIARRLGLLTAVVLLGVVGSALFFSRSITRPIREVMDGAVRMGTDLDTRIPVSSEDEVGKLASAVNGMAESLQQNRREQARIEENICHAEKLASIGEMASGLAHELNTPLGNIQALASLARKDVAAGSVDPAALAEDLQDIVSQTGRCSNILGGLLGFARARTPEKEAQEVEGLVSEALSLVRMRAGKKSVHLALHQEAALPRLHLDGAQVQQILVNLLLNAIDAAPAGGEVAVATAWEEGVLRLRVRDDGVGILPEHAGRIFDPFFTTKEVGKGTGLGLSVSYGIVKNLGGTIEVQSEPGRGSAFTVVLPAAEAGPA